MGKLEDMALLVAVAEAGTLRRRQTVVALAGHHDCTSEGDGRALSDPPVPSFHAGYHPDQRGEDFYHAARRVLDEARHAESLLTQKRGPERRYSPFRPLRLWPTIP